jgi:hypothetical protein
MSNKKYRPWTAEEAIGKIVIFKGDDIGWIQITATDVEKAHGVSCMGFWSYTYEELLLTHIQQGGEPCGVEIAE